MAVTWRRHAVQLAELFSFQSKLLFPRGVGEVGNPGLRPPPAAAPPSRPSHCYKPGCSRPRAGPGSETRRPHARDPPDGEPPLFVRFDF